VVIYGWELCFRSWSYLPLRKTSLRFQILVKSEVARNLASSMSNFSVSSPSAQLAEEFRRCIESRDWKGRLPERRQLVKEALNHGGHGEES
jgi:hypothetical protein